MERTGYPESFDTKTAAPIHDISSTEQQYREELLARKKQIFPNVIEFLVGSILLVFCYFYLQTHPAEKVSLFTWIETMWQKVTLKLKDFSGTDAALHQRKIQVEKTFQEIVFLAEQSTCLDATSRSNIENSYQRLKAMDLATYEKQQRAYDTVIGLYYTKVREECVK